MRRDRYVALVYVHTKFRKGKKGKIVDLFVGVWACRNVECGMSFSSSFLPFQFEMSIQMCKWIVALNYNNDRME